MCRKGKAKRKDKRKGETTKAKFPGIFFSNTTLLERKYNGDNKSNTNNNRDENVGAPISYFANDISKQFGIIYQIHDSLPIKARTQLYHSPLNLLKPYQTIRGSDNKSIISSLHTTQKRVISTISCQRKKMITRMLFFGI